MSIKKVALLFIIVSILILSLPGCGSSETNSVASPTAIPTPTPITTPLEVSPTPTLTTTPPTISPTSVNMAVAVSDKQRVTAPILSPAEMTQLVRGNSDFAFDLYQALSKEDGNLFYSPYSISLALAMAYAGARGETEQQMANTMHYILPQDQLHPAFNALDQELQSRGQGAKGIGEKGFRLNIANATWGQQDYQFLSTFLDILAVNYGAGLRLLDFFNAPEESRITINNWISDQTEGKIKDMIPPGSIQKFTRLVLTNAVYFNAAWLNPFDKDTTKDGLFHLLDGSEVIVPMMRQAEYFGYAKGDGYQAIELPYDGDELSMVILLPDADQFGSFEKQLNVDSVNAIINDMESKSVGLIMPKFQFRSGVEVSKTLAGMGMPIAFSAQADFSGITDVDPLNIDEVIHQAFVSVDEGGTVAAAATAVVIVAGSMPQPVIVALEHPFIFLIRDIETGSIVFMGRVLNPGV